MNFHEYLAELKGTIQMYEDGNITEQELSRRVLWLATNQQQLMWNPPAELYGESEE